MEENNCKYICSRGLLKSCDIHSSYPISSIQQLINYDFSKCTNGSTFYICTNAIKHFIFEIFPNLQFKIVLVTGDCDETCWEDLFSYYSDFISFIENEKIIHWFSQNCSVTHPKLSHMPIGLDYHTMTTEYHGIWGPKLNPIEQETILNNIIEGSTFKPFWERDVKCYSNFHFLMTTKHGYDRVDALNSIPKDLVYYEPNRILRDETWNKQIQYAFVISPHGGGLDCHRTWEALVLGCIPIIKTSGLDPVFNDLPVLIVKEWSDINEDLLQTTINDFKNKEFKYDRLLLSYWVNLINSK